jgi:hypothetical protein
MLENPKVSLFALSQRETEGDEVDEGVQAHDGEGDDGVALRAVIHPDWQNDEHEEIVGTQNGKSRMNYEG